MENMFAYREDGAKLDKIGISNSAFAPLGMGAEAENVCVTTGVRNSIEAPAVYALGQNYPNPYGRPPFNPQTTIRYAIPKNDDVKLKVYNLLGKEIETLVGKKQPAGVYEIQWNPVGLPSGVYFYRLQAGKFEATKKLILLQ